MPEIRSTRPQTGAEPVPADPPHRSSVDSRTMTVLRVAFFASGFAALLCQIVWQRMLGVFAGSDTVSASLVVGAFLAGLGLGSIIGARIADRLTPARALLGFALAEVGVAAFAIGSKHFLYDLLATGLAGTVDAPAAIFALCFAGLVVPTTLMGLSLPLLARAVATSLGGIAERIGSLYGLNTLGAGLGALAGGWVLIGSLGFVGTLWVAAALDLAAAGLALSLRGRANGSPMPSDDAPVPATAKASAAGSANLPAWCALVFVSGYVIVALEIVWVRVLGQIGMFHAYLFPTVLGVFLLADGVGIAVASRLLRRTSDPRGAFFAAQGAGFVLAALLLGGVVWAVPEWPLVLQLAVDDERLAWRHFALMGVLVAVAVGPPAFVIGMTFPFVQRAVQHDLSRVGERVGWVQLANIAGNAAGALLTGLVTLHVLGTAGTLRALALLTLALLLAGFALGRARRPSVAALAVACVALALATPGNGALWSRLHLERPGQLVAWAEDRSGVAFYRGEPAAGGHDGPFFIQGFAQGRIGFLAIHTFLGAIGPVLHPDPRDVMVIGVGSGGTPWAAGVRASTTVHAIELVDPVLAVHRDLARRVPDGPSARMVADPRWRLSSGDGRRLLARSSATYDVIEADALLPEGSLSGMLYGREFLQLARRRLAPGGLYVQWTPTCRSVETFRSVFPHAALLLPARVMVGSDSPIAIDPAAIAARFADPAVRAHLSHGEAEPLDAARFVRRAIVWSGGGDATDAPLTDLFPRDEFFRNQPRRRVIGDAPEADASPATGADRGAVPGCDRMRSRD